VLLDREGAVAKVRQQGRRDRVVIRERVELPERELRPPELVGVVNLYVSPR
jgi:hypothetical protein